MEEKEEEEEERGRPWEAGGWVPPAVQPCQSKDGWVCSLPCCPLLPPPPHQHIPSIPHDQDRPAARGEAQQRVSPGLKNSSQEKQKLSTQVGTHRSRVPWAVRIQREEEQEEWGKKVKSYFDARTPCSVLLADWVIE